MKLALAVVFLLLSLKELNTRIIDKIGNEQVAEIYSNVELTCKFNSNEVNWRKLNGVKINNILTL